MACLDIVSVYWLAWPAVKLNDLLPVSCTIQPTELVMCGYITESTSFISTINNSTLIITNFVSVSRQV